MLTIRCLGFECTGSLSAYPSDICLTELQVVVITIGFPSCLVFLAGWDIPLNLLSDRHVQGTIVTADIIVNQLQLDCQYSSSQ